MADLSPEVEACVEKTITRMYDTGTIGDLIDAGMTYDQIVDNVIQECRTQENTLTEIEIQGSNVYVKRSTTIGIAVVAGFTGIAIGALIMHLSMGD